MGMIFEHSTQQDNGQPSLFRTRELIAATTFEGSDIVAERDTERLRGQLLRIFELMKDGKWRTLESISAHTKAPHASVSAQLRHLRKARNGGHTINKRYIGSGWFQYQLIVNEGGE